MEIKDKSKSVCLQITPHRLWNVEASSKFTIDSLNGKRGEIETTIHISQSLLILQKEEAIVFETLFSSSAFIQGTRKQEKVTGVYGVLDYYRCRPHPLLHLSPDPWVFTVPTYFDCLLEGLYQVINETSNSCDT